MVKKAEKSRMLERHEMLMRRRSRLEREEAARKARENEKKEVKK